MAERCAVLDRVADAIDARFDDLVPLTQAETGATMRVAKTLQVPQAAARFRYYASPVDDHVALPPAVMPSTPLAPGGIVGAVEQRAPVGVVACLAAYNFPITNMAGKIAPALAMGNSVVIKPPVQDPLGTIVLCEAFAEAGLPPGVVNLVVGDTVEVAEAITTSPDVDMISFTGSTAVGLSHRRGGRAADEAPPARAGRQGRGHRVRRRRRQDRASPTCRAPGPSTPARSAPRPPGWWCSGAIYDEVVAKLGGMAGHLKVGDPLERDTVLGPVITGAHRERVEGYVASAIDEGATAVGRRGAPGAWRRASTWRPPSWPTPPTR